MCKQNCENKCQSQVKVLASLPGTFQHNRSPKTRKQSHRYRSWSRQVSVVELRDQSFSLHSRALSSIIAAPRCENSRTGTGHGVGKVSVVELRDQSFSLHSQEPFQHNFSSETPKQPCRFRSWSRQFSVLELRDQSFSLHSQALSSIIAGPPETRKQPHQYMSWSRQVSVVELRDQSFSLHSRALSSIIAAPRCENSRTGTGHGVGKVSVVELRDQSFSLHSQEHSSILADPRRENSRSGTVVEQAIFRRGAPPETRKQPHRYRSWSRQFSVVELRDQSFSLHSQALSSIIAAPRRENSRTGTGHGAGNFPSWSSMTNPPRCENSRIGTGHGVGKVSVVELRDQSSETRKQPHRYRSWSRQFSVVELRDQSFSLHSQALSNIIAGPPETRKQPHRYRSWSKQVSAVELRDQSFSTHSRALPSIIAAPRCENSRTGTGHGAGNFPSWSSVTNRSRFTPRTFQHNCRPETRKQPHRYRSWSRQFSVVELRDQSFSLHSRALSCIIAGPSWRRQVSVVELRDQSFSLHIRALSSIIAATRRENRRTGTGHGVGKVSVVELRDQLFSLHSHELSSIIAGPPKMRKQPHRYRSWSRQFSVVELHDQSFSLHSWALSSIIAGPSWSRQFSVVELGDQSFSLHSRALSSIIAAPRRENSRTGTDHGVGKVSVVELHDQSPETRKQPHWYRSWSRQFSVVELRDQSFSLHSQALSSIIAGPPETRKLPQRYRSWSRQVPVVELRDQLFSLHSQELSSIIEDAKTATPIHVMEQTIFRRGASLPIVLASLLGTFQHHCSPETRKQPHRYRSWSRQFSVVELRDQSFSLHSQALSSIIAAPRRENNRTGTGHGVGKFRSWSSVTNLFSLHSQELSSIFEAPRRENSRTDTGHGADNFPSWSSPRYQSFSLHSWALSSIIAGPPETRKQPHRYRSWSRQFSVVELRDQSFSLHSLGLSKPRRYRSWSMQFSVVELRDQSFSLHSQALSSIIAAPRRENGRTDTGHRAGNFPSWSSVTNRSRFTPRHFPA
ncbi:unnamed protein product [Closterium sp. Yama58-4]|nr:unnamed protein product [Closterium sp. Yama58-4]